MVIERSMELCIAQTTLQLPCFFPSISSVKTNLLPVDYLELLVAIGHSPFLVSAYDIAHCTDNDNSRISVALARSRNGGSVILMDSWEL